MRKVGLATILFCTIGGTLGIFIYYQNWVVPFTRRTPHIYLNETDNHTHDLALRMSLNIAGKRSGIENDLLILKALPDGMTIEKLATHLFSEWTIGSSHEGKGILYIYSVQENLFKIEVSYLLEGVLPDVVCRRLEQAAQTYLLSEVPQDFLSELLITINLHAENELRVLSDVPNWYAQHFISGGGGISSKIRPTSFSEYMNLIEQLPSEAVKKFLPSASVEETLSSYLKSLSLGYGDPQIPLISEGSRVFRMLRPRNYEQQIQTYSFYKRAYPYSLRTEGDLAVALFSVGQPTLPIVLRREDSLWYVDEPKAWTYFHRFEDSSNFFPKYDDIPFIRFLREMHYPNAFQPLYSHRVSTPFTVIKGSNLQQTSLDLESQLASDPDNEDLLKRLGELYLFEVNWLSKSIEMYERAARVNPDRLEHRWRLVDLYLNASQADDFLRELSFLASSLPDDREVQALNKFYTEAYHDVDQYVGEPPTKIVR